MKNTTETGRFGESAACEYLRKSGYKIISRNYRASHNEIDIIAEDKHFIIFAEVKARSQKPFADNGFGTPAAAVTYAKQKRIIAAAQAYLYEHPSKKIPRLDVIEVYLGKDPVTQDLAVLKINHIENAYTN